MRDMHVPTHPHPTSATPMRIPFANPHFAGVSGRPCHPQFSRIAENGRVRVPKSLTHILDLLFVIASRQVWSPGQANRPYLQKSSVLHHGYSFYVIVMKQVMALGHLHLLPIDKK